MARMTVREAARYGGENMLAFLDTLAWSELGDAILAGSDDGYDVFVGSTPAKIDLFTSYADHPQRIITITLRDGRTIRSTAAGRYQFLAKTWDALVPTIGAINFEPWWQDRGAIALIAGRGALYDVMNADIDLAIRKCGREWASLPDNDYHQPGQHSLDALIAVWTAARARYRADFSNVTGSADSTAPKDDR